ncbi:MAG: nucleotide sugar dehydrogenase [Acidobacteriota bacterium]
MNVCVVGLWHLGTVTAACLAAGGHDVTGLDFEPEVIGRLSAGSAPLFEPGLEDLVRSGLAAGALRFTTSAATALANAEVVWVTYDTPVDEDDRADVDYVVDRTVSLFPHLRTGALVLLSSQLPVGTTGRIEQLFAAAASGRSVGFGYSPENLRLGKAIDIFMHPDRVVVGVRSVSERDRVTRLFQPFTDCIEWMSVESAEMTKHALNAFLATSVVFINEIAALCEQVGADAAEVSRGLKSDARIGPKAYLSPGGAFAGGTLARDVVCLSTLARVHGVAAHLLSSVKASNDAHRHWAELRLAQLLGSVAGRTIGVWGLTYKPGTDTLRRSSAVELCRWLHARRARVRAYDPLVRTLPAGLDAEVELTGSAVAAVDGASALVVATPWPEYRTIAPGDVVARMARPLVLDANRFLAGTLGDDAAIEYVSVGAHRRPRFQSGPPDEHQ